MSDERPTESSEPSIHALKVQILSLQVDIVKAAAELRHAELDRDQWKRIAEMTMEKLKTYENKA